MLGNRYSQHSFAQTPSVNMARSQFDRSFGAKDTMNFDYLVPIFVDEILPGDTCNLNVNSFARLATPKVPIMDNMYLDFFFFFVPNRLIWDNWERFNGAQDNPADSTSFILPQITAPAVTGFVADSIFDHMGLPTGVPSLLIKNTLPFRAYNRIWNEWFRDQNLQNSLTVQKDNGPDNVANYVLQKRGKRHDYFTSALPWPQKGTAVTLPLGTSATVKYQPATVNTNAARILKATDRSASAIGEALSSSASTFNAATMGPVILDPNNTLYADLSTATSATINSLRQAFQIQSMLELDARGGTRYVEILQAHFNVTSPDFRLQRSEYLGGGEARINCHPVAQTAPTSGSNAMGSLAAFGTSATSGSQVGFTKSFVEHGYVIGLAAARADITYQQGLNKMWDRSTRYDFFWPKLQELGEQAILMKEIYATATAADDTVFGYQERYAEYRYKPSEIRGQFRSTYATPLDMWHMAEKFATAPALNSTFIQSNTPIDRAIAVAGTHLLVDFWFDYKHARPMLTYSTPSTIGKF